EHCNQFTCDAILEEIVSLTFSETGVIHVNWISSGHCIASRKVELGEHRGHLLAIVETEAEFMVTVPIHQASTLVPPLSTSIIDLSPLKLVSSLQEPFITATTEATTTTLLLPPHLSLQSIKDKTINAPRVYTLENHDLYSKIDKQAPGQAPVGRVNIREPLAKATRQLPVVEGKGKGIATDEQAALSLLDLHKPKKKNAKTEANTDITTSTANIKILYAEDAQDLGKTPDSRPPPEHEHMDEDQAGPNPRQSHVALAGPNPKPMHDDFIGTVYPKVHERLKHTTEEHVHLENPLSSSGTLSSMKNLDDTFTFDDQFLNDKPTEDKPGKAIVETEAEFMVTVPIHQASTLVPFTLPTGA
nr:hypothetical protein [Tanacetum cinerariifolium]